MARILEDESARGIHVGAHPAVARGDLGERSLDVEPGQGVGRGLDARDERRPLLAQLDEQLVLACLELFLGAQDLALLALERRRHEALGAGERLAPLVVRRDAVEVRTRHLEVVAEHAVEPDLEARDAGARAFLGLELGNPALARVCELVQAVTMGVETVPNQTPIARERRGLVDQGAREQ